MCKNNNEHAFNDELVIRLDSSITLDELVYFSEKNKKVKVAKDVENRVKASRDALSKMVEEGETIYGVNTSMGGFVDKLVPLNKAEELQKNLINAVATNVGSYFDDHISRASFLARIISLSKGNSAISLENFIRMINIYNAGIIPCIPEKGSLGTSGDLGPLAAIALCLIGQWKVKFNGHIIDAKEALDLANLEPLSLNYKEGLALINGTSAMVGLAAVNTLSAEKLLDKYISISALSIEGFCAKVKPFDPQVHIFKPHKGQRIISEKLWKYLNNSKMVIDEDDLSKELARTITNEVKSCEQPIEDGYSIRCTPQILGPIYDNLKFIRETVENELNSSNDNPLIIPDSNKVYHNGHFHGQYIAMAMDYLVISLIVICNLSERRIDRFLTSSNSNGLPPFLCKENPGLRLGLMGGQFMSASLTAENRSLATPLSIQTLPTTAGFQDVVSFGLIASRRAREVLINTRYVIAFELICACQAVEIRGNEKLSPYGYEVFKSLRNIVPYLKEDIILTSYLETVVDEILQ
ncbi:phenylalanine aminomutase (D-beta-phenylalanine forming) [Klebsiella quasipneumoniae]|uniref:phenylalanine aminomutase (D-beta-phenylalanine forming) n=1 Tax=Klebsiella quasipneumoniae TaxID=1463165 RepID=UPI00103511C3|nr:phenylalanine aminomutase (D-beta-phenylalanine forming) [Klebsiella quasipneumoniae]